MVWSLIVLGLWFCLEDVGVAASSRTRGTQRRFVVWLGRALLDSRYSQRCNTPSHVLDGFANRSAAVTCQNCSPCPNIETSHIPRSS
jgi:hypothetical protein